MTLDHVLQLSADLPTFPNVAMQVVKACDDSDTTARSLSKLVAEDPSLTTRMLRLANSSFFGMERRINDLSDAIVILGLRNVRHLSLIASTYGWLEGVGLPRTETTRIWIHSLGMGLGTDMVAKLSPKINAGDGFTAGLLSEIGRVALAVAMPEATMGAYDVAMCGVSLDDAELQIFGYNHTHVGAALAESWSFPYEIVETIRYHHTPDEGGHAHLLAACAHVADGLLSLMGLGYGRDGVISELSDAALEQLGLNADDLDQIINPFVEEYERHECMCQGMHQAA